MNPSVHIPPPVRRDGREGIALIIVLGLLAVLVLLGVSFSISMRTERMATRSFVDVVKARQLVHGAVNRVLDEEINNYLQDSVYPPLDVFTDAISGPGNVNVFWDRTTISPAVFLPGSLRAEAFATEAEVDWQELRDPVSDEFYGEYAFLAVNCSGLLDANAIGGLTRAQGSDPREIPFNEFLLQELNGANGANIPTYRNAFGKFESVSELYYLLSTTDFQGDLGVRPLMQNSGPNGSWADNLFVFSRYPRGYAELGLTAGDQAFIGGDPAAWNMSDIATKLASLEGPTLIPNMDDFIAAMVDYADETYIPYGANQAAQFERFSSKPIPMINEVIVSNTLQLVDNGGQEVLRHRVYVTIETWYPFPNDPDNPTFSVEMTADISNPQVQPAYPNFNAALTRISGPDPANFQPNTGNGYHVTQYVYQQEQDVNGQSQPPYAPGGLFRLRVQMQGNIQVTWGPGNDPVDIVFGPWGNTSFTLSGARPAITVGGAAAGVGSISYGANDPRINWDPSATAQWAAMSPASPGSRNDPRISSTGPADEFDFMYARRGPIESVGELGFLLYDENKPWQTIRLIGENPVVGARLIDRLTPFTNSIRRGMVNINTRQTSVLASSMLGMPIEKYPGGGVASTFNAPAAVSNFAQYIVNRIASEGAVTNLSDISERLESAEVDSALSTTDDKFLRESLIRNTVGLWGTRNQVFTLFVSARVFSDQYDPALNLANRDDFVVGEQQAVVVVWRDPFQTTDSVGNTTHESYIQFFHWFAGAFQ
jgi:hypothetical protein